MDKNIYNTELKVKFCDRLGEDVVLARENEDGEFHCMCSELCRKNENCEHYGSTKAING